MGITLPQERRLPVFLAAVGFFVSGYLQWLHVQAWLDPASGGFCAINERLDCVAVALSPWSSFAGLPVAGWGLLGFWMLLVAAWRGSRWLVPLSAVAALASLALLIVEIVTVGAVCLFCEAAHLVSWLLLAVVLRRRESWVGPWKDTSFLVAGPLPAAGVALAALLLLPSYWKGVTWKGEVPFAHGLTAEGHPWLGATEPVLTIEEWVDYGCPHCAAASSWMLRRVSANPDSLRLVRRHNPRMYCSATSAFACLYARAALCGQAQGKAWQMDRWLFVNQTKKPVLDVEKAAHQVGLDAETLRRCMSDPKTFAAAGAEYKQARRARMISTPGYVVDGKRVNLADLEKRLEAIE